MFNFTKQERVLLSVFVLIMLMGSTVHFALKKYPQLNDIVNFIDSERVYQKFDLNKASAEELVNIPYIGQYTAQNIVEYRQNNGPFKTVEEVKKVKGVRNKNFEKFSPYLKVKR